MKKLPIGIQNFKEIVTENYLYIDKTQYIYSLINGAKYCFLSRPRRFGKSLFLDTIGEAFGGDKELFRGLWIYDSDYTFPKHPVIRLDMSGISNRTPEALEASIKLLLKNRINIESFNNSFNKEFFDFSNANSSDVFRNLIIALYNKYNQKVVVLIDEYDKPILDHIDDINTAEENRKILRSLYGILKSMDPYLRFVFITGVSKFTKTSIFSGLNNLKDITMLEEYANICGIPVDDFDTLFGDYLEGLASNKKLKQHANIRDAIFAWYDGYSWDGESKLLNPFSLLNFFDQKRFSGFWYSSGTPRFLLELIKKKPESYCNITHTEINEYMLDSIEIENITIEPLLFQTGYLTIKEIPITLGSPVYILDIPNFEVREAFNLQVLSALTETDDVRVWQARTEMMKALQENAPDKLLIMLRALFASIPYELHVDREAYYHSIFYTIMSMLGFDMDVEVSTSRGRADAVLELDNIIYVMEFKYVKCPPDAGAEEKRELSEAALSEAIAQINEKGYAAKYNGRGKSICIAAFAFLGRDDIWGRYSKS